MRLKDERMMGLRRRCREGMGGVMGHRCIVLCTGVGVSAVRGSTFGQLCSKPLEVCWVLQELHQLPHLVLGLLNLAAT